MRAYASHGGLGGEGAACGLRGFTLIELIATMTILATLSIVSGTIVNSAVESYSQGSELVDLHNAASLAMERLVRDIRSLPPNVNNQPDISSFAPSAMTWDNGSHSIAVTNGQLVYTRDGVSRVLLDNVSSISLKAYGQDNVQLSSTLSGSACEAIRRIEMTISVAQGSVSNTIRTRIFLRCMMFENIQ